MSTAREQIRRRGQDVAYRRHCACRHHVRRMYTALRGEFTATFSTLSAKVRMRHSEEWPYDTLYMLG